MHLQRRSLVDRHHHRLADEAAFEGVSQSFAVVRDLTKYSGFLPVQSTRGVFVPSVLSRPKDGGGGRRFAAGRVCEWVLSEFERDQVSERTRFALQYKRACREKTGGEVPHGYRLEGARLVPDAAEQRAITLISELRLAGNSLRQIARELEARGYRTKSGLAHWHPQIVKQILERKAA